MVSNYLSVWPYCKAQIGMQVVRKNSGKKRSLREVNEHFSRNFYVQDAPNMGFCQKGSK